MAWVQHQWIHLGTFGESGLSDPHDQGVRGWKLIFKYAKIIKI